MNCEQMEHKILEYLDGELTDEESDILLEHVEGCERCARFLENQRKQDQLLERYFDTMKKAALGGPKPDLPEPQKAEPSRRLYYHIYAAAAVIAILVLSGLSLFMYHRAGLSRSGELVGRAISVEGLVQVLEGKEPRILEEGMRVSSRSRLKITADSYLAVETLRGNGNLEPNIVEFKENTLASFHAHTDRTELRLERGEIWVHLNRKPEKTFVVRTRQARIYDRGTIYNVAQGMTGALAGVVTGQVVVEGSGEEKVVSPKQLYTTYEDKTGDSVRKHVYWSHYKEKLLALLGPEQEPDVLVADGNQLLVREYPGKKQVPPQIAEEGEAPLGTLSSTELLPVDTRFFFEIASLPEIVRDWNSSDYSRLLDDPDLRQWWESGSMAEYRNAVNSFGASRWIKLMNAVSGSVSCGITGSGGFLIVADCREDVESIPPLLEKEIDPLMKIWSIKAGHKKYMPRVRFEKGYLLIAVGSDLVERTLKAVEEDAPTGFTKSPFYQKIVSNVPNSRMTVAYDFHSTAESIREGGNSDMIKFLERSGMDNLDYILGSPDFAGRGINQAFRIAFEGERHGILGWLDEPSAMGSLRFFSPDVHLLAAARIKSPEVMFTDILTWLLEDNPSPSKKDEKVIAWIRELSSCFGNEAAIGLQNPIFPVPNFQLAVEMVDPMKFHDLMLEWVDFMDEDTSVNIAVEGTEYRDQMIFTITIPKQPFDISYVVLDDFLMVGLGESMMRHTVDVFLESQSLMDVYAFTSLLPDSGQLNFSMLVYQDLTRTIPQFSNRFSLRGSTMEKSLLPGLNAVERFQSAGISYAFSTDNYIDFYFNGSTGVDINLGGTLPLVAGMLLPRSFANEFDQRYSVAVKSIQMTGTALEAYYVDHNTYPATLEDLLSPVSYMVVIPTDPLDTSGRGKIRYRIEEGGRSCVIYSVGPDGKDDGGAVLYDPTNGTSSSGDIIRFHSGK